MNKYKNIMLVFGLIFLVSLVTALPAKTVYKHEPVLMAEGWNGLGIIPDYDTLVQGDFNLSLVNSTSGAPNLLGMSFVTPNGKCISLDSLTFWDVDDNSMNYQDAKTNNWIEPIEFDSGSGASGVIEEFTKLCPYESVWVKSFLAVKFTIPNVLGSPIGETFDWADLRFSNGTDELSIGDASNAGWIDANLQYHNTTINSFEFIAEFEDKTSVDSWLGIRIFSFEPNIYLLTNNETKRNHIKIKCNAKFIGDDGICKMPNGKAKYVGGIKIFKQKYWTSHIIRLIGTLRPTKG